MDVLAQHDGRERTEALAELDLEIDGGLHLGRARVAQYAPRPEGARAELGAPMEPPHDLPLRQQVRYAIEQRALVAESLVRRALRGDEGVDLVGRVRRSQPAGMLRITVAGGRGLSSSWCQTNNAAPSAPPASPAAG